MPEFVQHVVEIQNGMFDSREGAMAFANTPLRMQFGTAKIIGLVLAFLACARVWWCREHGGRWYSVARIDWLRVIGGIAIIAAVSFCTWPLRGHVAAQWLDIADLVLSLVTLPLIFFILSGLFADRSITLAALYRRGWPYTFLLLLLLAAAFMPAQFLHGQLHRWAIGQSRGIVWALMSFDALVVGLIAALVGAALYTGYAAMAARITRPAR